jgi:hypothetical protein
VHPIGSAAASSFGACSPYPRNETNVPDDASAVPENRQSYVDRTISAARRLSNSQIFLIFLVPGIVTLIEHFVYDGTSALWESALFALAAVCIALGLGGVNMLLTRRAAGRATHTLKQAPYPEHRWSLVAVSVGPFATSDGQAENGGRSPSPEQAAIHNLLVPEGPRKVVLIHSPDTRAAAERLGRHDPCQLPRLANPRLPHPRPSHPLPPRRQWQAHLRHRTSPEHRPQLRRLSRVERANGACRPGTRFNRLARWSVWYGIGIR